MKKIDLKFGDKTFTAKFGIGFIGRYLKENNQKIDQMFADFEANPFYTAPNLMYYAIKEGTPDFSLSAPEFEELIDDNGGINCPQLISFIEAFTKSLTADLPAESVGKSRKAKPRS